MHVTGVNSLNLDGQGGDDTLTVNVPTTSDAIVHTAAVADDAGSVQVGALRTLAFSGLGASGSVVILDSDGGGTLTYAGNGVDNSYDVQAGSGASTESGVEQPSARHHDRCRYIRPRCGRRSELIADRRDE